MSFPLARRQRIHRVCFGGLALLVSWIALTEQLPNGRGMPRRLQACLLIFSLGVIAPWKRWIGVSLRDPGGRVGWLTQILGWCGVAVVALVPEPLPWWCAILGPLVAGLAFALWNDRRWAFWPWVGVAAACAVAGCSIVGVTLADSVTDGVDPTRWEHRGHVAVELVTFGVYLLYELRAWRKRIDAPIVLGDFEGCSSRR